LKQGTNAEIGLKNFFEIASIYYVTITGYELQCGLVDYISTRKVKKIVFILNNIEYANHICLLIIFAVIIGVSEGPVQYSRFGDPATGVTSWFQKMNHIALKVKL
jgi:hypothetical protein